MPNSSRGLPNALLVPQLTQLVRKWYGGFFDRKPLLQLFGTPQPVLSNTVVWEEKRRLLKTGTFRTKPGVGERVDLDVIQRHYTKALWQSLTFDIESDHLIGLRMAGSNDLSMVEQEAVNLALIDLDGKVRERVEYMLRTVNDLIAELLSTGSETLTLKGGAQLTVGTGIPTASASASWATASTDIMVDMEDFLYQFRRRNQGLNPNLIILPPKFHNTYVSPNTKVREFLLRFPELAKGQARAAGILTPEDVPYRVILMEDARHTGSDADKGEYDSLTDVWPSDKMTLLRVENDDPDWKLFTTRDESNQYNGGIGIYSYQGDDPMSTSVNVSGSHVPIIKDKDKVLICDLDP